MGLFGKVFSGEKNQSKVEWTALQSIEDLMAAIKESHKQPVVLFKHSTRCSISSSALNRLERSWNNDITNAKPYFLDLIKHRDVSAEIANQLGVTHQSPQMIVVKEGKAVFNTSHMEISFEDVKVNAPS